MKPRSIFACAFSAGVIGSLLFVTTGATRESGRDVAPSEIEELKDSVVSLKKQVADLEKRLKILEAKTNIVVLPPLSRNLPGNALWLDNPVLQGWESNMLPNKGKIWGQGECNGWTYYLVPLSASDRVKR